MADKTELVVQKTLLVTSSQKRAFEVFTELFGSWWPLVTHHIGADPAQTAIIEPKAHGRWFERAANGAETDWGRVLVWEPPHRIVLSWDIGTDWKYDATLGTEVEVRFVPEGPGTTRVEFEHRRLDRYGAQAKTMQEILSRESGWPSILGNFTNAATKG